MKKGTMLLYSEFSFKRNVLILIRATFPCDCNFLRKKNQNQNPFCPILEILDKNHHTFLLVS